MFKRIFSNESIRELNELSPEQQNQVKIELIRTNNKRLLIFSILTAFLELMLIIFNDIPNIMSQSGDYNISLLYLVFHSLILMTSLTVLVLLNRFKNKLTSRLYNYLSEAIVLSGMIWMAFIGVLDQLTLGNFTSYITIFIVVGIAVLIKSPNNFIVYTIPQVLFLTLSFYFQEDTNMLMDVFVNGTMFYLCVLFISKITYENHLDHIVKNMVLEEINKKLEYISNYDFLTGLYNRRYFETILKENVINVTSLSKSAIFLGIMDIDHFKTINDQYGHKTGDLVLEQVAELIRKSIQEDAIYARWGGEEFVFLFTEKDKVSSHELMEGLRLRIEQAEIYVDGKAITMTVSSGITQVLDTSELSFTNAFKNADQALYSAKENGRNRVEWF